MRLSPSLGMSLIVWTAAIVAAQDQVVTFYVTPIADPRIIGASAVAVDGAGATYYRVAAQERFFIPTTTQGRMTTINLAIPTPVETFTFRADASRFLFVEAKEEPDENGDIVNAEWKLECQHNIDADTPPDQAVNVCKQGVKFYQVRKGTNGASSTYTYLHEVGTTTAQPFPFVTVTNAASLDLPTISAAPLTGSGSSGYKPAGSLLGAAVLSICLAVHFV